MRGRYKWAISLFILFAIGGGYGGFKLGRRVYASVGMVRVMAVVPKVLYTVDDKGTIPMFDSFVESQAALLRSQRVMDLAMQDPAWQALGKGTADRAAEELQKNMLSTHDGELLKIQA